MPALCRRCGCDWAVEDDLARRGYCRFCFLALGMPIAYADRDEARAITKLAIESGMIPKPNLCSECHQPTPPPQLHAHHEDYTKPLEIEWLCRGCHVHRHHGEAA